MIDEDPDTIAERSHQNYLNIHKHYSNDLLIDEELYEMQNKLLTMSEYLVLTFLYLINSCGYIYLPFVFVLAVAVGYYILSGTK